MTVIVAARNNRAVAAAGSAQPEGSLPVPRGTSLRLHEGEPSHLRDPAFGGNFCGNRGGPDLETAGWRPLTSRGYAGALTGVQTRDHPGRPDFRYSGAFGSFGAACTEGCAG